MITGYHRAATLVTAGAAKQHQSFSFLPFYRVTKTSITRCSLNTNRTLNSAALVSPFHQTFRTHTRGSFISDSKPSSLKRFQKSDEGQHHKIIASLGDYCTRNVTTVTTTTGAVTDVANEVTSSSLHSKKQQTKTKIRLSKLISLAIPTSRRNADELVSCGDVKIGGKVVTEPYYRIGMNEDEEDNMELIDSIKVWGKRLEVNLEMIEMACETQSTESLASKNNRSDSKKNKKISSNNTRVWIVNKLSGELVTEHDPAGRPTLLERLYKGGVGKNKSKGKPREHLKPIGRLDMLTEGLILVTNNGAYAHDMELPANKLHRVYRARVHGKLTSSKLKAIRSGFLLDGVRYKGMGVKLEVVPQNKKNRTTAGGSRSQNRGQKGNAQSSSTNIWMRISCVEGKNRQIRKILSSLGLNVTRLIRISFGDYILNTVPAGMALEVPVKLLEAQRRRGKIIQQSTKQRNREPRKNEGQPDDYITKPVEWIKQY